MIRYFCDLCENETVSANKGACNPLDRITATIKRGDASLTVEVLESTNGTANKGNFCVPCVIAAITQLSPSADSADAARYRWLRDVGDRGYAPLTRQWNDVAAGCDKLIDLQRFSLPKAHRP